MPEPVGLERLIAHQEIGDLCRRYARGADRLDVGVFTSVFWIKTRRLIFDYCTVRPGSALLAGEGMTAFGAAKMARDRSDPSYAR